MLVIDFDGRKDEIYVIDADVQVGVSSDKVSKSYNLDELQVFVKKLEGELLLKSALLKNKTVKFNPTIPLGLKEIHPKVFSGFVDEFFVSPFVTRISFSGGEVEFLSQEISRNNVLMLKWLQSFNAFNSLPFRYVLPSEVPDIAYIVSEGYRGVRTKFDNISWITTLYSDLSYFKMPLIVEVFKRHELDLLEKFVEQNESSGRLENPIIVIPYLKEQVKFDLYGFMGVKNVFLCTSPLQITTLKQLIYNLSEIDSEWFKHIIFGSGFPYSSIRDVVNSVVLLLDEDLPGGLRAFKWIMGLNALSFLPPKARREGDIETGEICVVAEGDVAKTLVSSLKRVILHAVNRNSLHLDSCDCLAVLDRECVDLNKCFFTFSSIKEKKFGSILFLLEENGETATILLVRQEVARRSRSRFLSDFLEQPEIQAAILNASKLTSNTDVENWLKWLIEHYKERGIVNYEDINVFTVHTFDLKDRVALMNEEDMRFLNLKEGDLIVSRTTLTGDWYIVPVKVGENVPGGSLWVDEKVINTWYVFEGDTVRVEKFEGVIHPLKEVVLVSDEAGKIAEIKESVESILDGIIVGQNSRIVLLTENDMPHVVTVAKFDPAHLTAGLVKRGETRISLLPKSAFTPYNLILIIDFTETMGKCAPVAVDPAVIDEIKHLTPISAEGLLGEANCALAASLALSYLLTKIVKVSNLSKVFLLTCSDEVSKFSLLEGRKVSSYLEITPQKQNVALKILISHIFDKCKHGCKGNVKLSEAANEIKNLIESVKDGNTFLVLFVIPGERLEEALKATEHLKGDNRVKVVFISIESVGSAQEVKDSICIREVKPETLNEAIKHLLSTTFLHKS
ncbi:MAG: hypothetical protein QXK94_07480 [Candidatus Jordarchaeales archaeon]